MRKWTNQYASHGNFFQAWFDRACIILVSKGTA
jgi:hypothetical protein